MARSLVKISAVFAVLPLIKAIYPEMSWCDPRGPIISQDMSGPVLCLATHPSESLMTVGSNYLWRGWLGCIWEIALLA